VHSVQCTLHSLVCSVWNTAIQWGFRGDLQPVHGGGALFGVQIPALPSSDTPVEVTEMMAGIGARLRSGTLARISLNTSPICCVRRDSAL